jgi:hypothetical protein
MKNQIFLSLACGAMLLGLTATSVATAAPMTAQVGSTSARPPMSDHVAPAASNAATTKQQTSRPRLLRPDQVSADMRQAVIEAGLPRPTGQATSNDLRRFERAVKQLERVRRSSGTARVATSSNWTFEGRWWSAGQSPGAVYYSWWYENSGSRELYAFQWEVADNYPFGCRVECQYYDYFPADHWYYSPDYGWYGPYAGGVL